jgi:DNA-binding beta-propeller fold protein YncE
MATQSWIITTAVGTGEKGYAGDGGPATRAQLNGPFDLGFDTSGNLYFSDTFNHCIRRVDAGSNVITTLAGCGEPGYSGDGGPATGARFNEPYGIAVDRSGNVYVADRHNHCVRRLEAASGIVTTFAGNGCAGFGGDDGPAARAAMSEPNGLALDPAQSRLFIADVADHRVRVVDLASGAIWTFAGTGEAEHSGDGGPATKAGIYGARAVKVAADGTVYVLERQGSALRAVDPNGVITTLAGTGVRSYTGDNGPALAATFDAPKELTIDREGNLLIVDTENHAIRKIDIHSKTVATVIGSGRQGGDGDGGPATGASLDRPHGAAVAADGSIYIGDTNNHRVRKVARAH